MSPIRRKLGIAAFAVLALLLVLALVTALQLRREEGRPLAAYGPPPDAPTRHVDIAKLDGNFRVVDLSEDELAGRGIAKHTLGDLELPSGAIVVADPLVTPERPALARRVTPGRYPVNLYRAQERVALAELRFAPGAPVRWQMALIPGRDATTLKDGAIFGYPVDARLGCFMDVEGRTALLAREEREEEARGKDRFNAYDDLLKAPLDANGGDELLFKPLDDKAANVAIFHSGWGDGFYASYWGLDETGRPLVLVTDFDVLESGRGGEAASSPAGKPRAP